MGGRDRYSGGFIERHQIHSRIQHLRIRRVFQCDVGIIACRVRNIADPIARIIDRTGSRSDPDTAARGTSRLRRARISR
jgi:hypothetical protein